MQVEIWSDVVCPWCYIGKRRFEEALAGFEHADQVEVRWRSFELDPGAPAHRDRPYVEHLATKYQMSIPEAQASIDHMVALGAADDLTFNFEIAQPGNTFDAHRLLHLAERRGRANDLKGRLFEATFAQGEAIGERQTLAKLAIDTGLDPAEVRTVLEGDSYAAEVRADEQRARRLGISAVPFFVIDGKYGVPGAQPAEILKGALEEAWGQH